MRVFTLDGLQRKIPLARLNEGDYFGEQSLLGQGAKTRSASIETLSETELVRIEAKTIIPLWEKNKELTATLKKIGHEQDCMR